MTDYIGRYRAEQVVGSGAFATVWLATDEALGASVAIKVLAENWAHDPEIRERFMEEARILWRADSDHIIRIHNVDALPDGRPYFVMDYADRGTLGQRMRERAGAGRSWSVDETIAVTLAVADGLKVAHALGIVHRDLKPTNVMFQSVPTHHSGGRDEKLILVDFGIAKSLARSRGTTISAGTPHYMPPEQLEGRVDERSDIYAAAVLTYELLAGRVPYPYETFRELLVAVDRRDEPQPITELRPDVPPELAAAIRTGLSLDLNLRWPTVAAWADAVAGARIAAARTGWAAPAAVPPIDPTVAAGAAGAAGAAAVAGAAGVAAAASGAPQPLSAPPPPSPPQYAAPPPATPAAPAPTDVTGTWATPPPQQGSGGSYAVESSPPGSGAGPPPAVPPPGGSGGDGGGGRQWWKIVVPIVAVLVIAGAAVGAVFAVKGGEDSASAATALVLQPAASVGQNPFTPSVVPTPGDASTPKDKELLDGLNPPIGSPSTLKLPKLAIPQGSAGQIPSVAGSAPGLYGGTQLLSVCDKRRLIAFLTANPEKARAWANVQGIAPAGIPAYISGLTDVILQADTRVLNHGFVNGVANPIDEILQAGTAVLVDQFGVPRARCYCGNPLLPPHVSTSSPRLVGTPWPGFVLQKTVIIQKVTIIDEFSIDDALTDGTYIYRRPGTPPGDATLTPTIGAGAATTAQSATTEAATEPATTEAATTAEPPPETTAPSTDITSQGGVNATSEFSSQFPASLAVDGDPTTSWFSGGSNADGDTSTFAWGSPSDALFNIDTVKVVSNAANSTPDFRSGFGFEQVEVVVARKGKTVWSQTVPLPGTPDPDVTVHPGVVGDRVYLYLTGHEAANCGGFAELIVKGSPA